jgi:hypothetical protein
VTELTFRLIVSLTVLVAVASLAAEEISTKGLPEHLRTAKERMKSLAVASSKQNPLQGLLRISLVLGYLISLVALAFFVPFSPWSYLFFTIAWSILAVIDAPHILPRCFVPLYEASLLLNGAILGLCFLSPLATRFSAH